MQEKGVNLNTECGEFLSGAKLFKGIKVMGEVSAECVNNVCHPFCLNESDQYTGPSKVVCQKKGRKAKVVPAKSLLRCAEPTDTACGNLAPRFRFAAGHSGNIECSQVNRLEICKVTCAEPGLSPSLPQVLCKPAKKGKTMFVPPKAAPITCEG